jgi:hypothetical protein
MNKNLNNAKRNKNDEFYTQLGDIEKELKHYKVHFDGKVVLCNCDDPSISQFFHYFSHNFNHLGLKKLITVCYKNQQRDLFSKHDDAQAIYLEYNGPDNKNDIPNPESIEKKQLKGNGDFRSEECVELLKEADIVCTNPPFSLFREYVAQLIEYKKKFLIVGHFNAVTYKEIFPLIRDNKIWLGVNNNQSFVFKSPYKNTLEANRKFCERRGYKGDHYIKVPGINWYTNLQHRRRNEELILVKRYKGNEKDYPKYDNYDAIEVSKVVDIPRDYEGVMGVPITFLDKYNPEQFHIFECNEPCIGLDILKQLPEFKEYKSRQIMYGGKLCQKTYHRLFIRRKIS